MKKLRDMALPKAKEIVSSNPVVVFRFLFFSLLFCVFIEAGSDFARMLMG